jgi:hypothetical protein
MKSVDLGTGQPIMNTDVSQFASVQLTHIKPYFGAKQYVFSRNYTLTFEF